MPHSILWLGVIGFCLLQVYCSDIERNDYSIAGLDDETIRFVGRNFQLMFASSDHKPIILHESADISCKICDVTASILLDLRKEKKLDKSVISSILIKECETSSYKNYRICKDEINSKLDQLLYIFDNGRNVTAEKLCTLRVGASCHNQFDYFNWTVSIPEKPTTLKKKVIQENDQNLRILQITDIHLDPYYTVSAKSLCGEPICCQSDQLPDNDEEETCGIWGDFHEADTPRKTFHDVLRQIGTHENIDFVYFTGDTAGHRTWTWGRNETSDIEREVTESIIENFDVPVLFVLGNHDSFPYNLYAPNEVGDELSTEWVFDLLTEELRGIVADDDLETIHIGGFYTVLLKPGFRVIVLNNNVCSLRNTWLLYEDYDPYGQLSWLVNVLTKAEENGEYVHILYHYPTGIDACLGTWSREFARIISRFSDTVTGQFNGHTHIDQFFLLYDEENSSNVVNVAFNGASISPLSENNPSYKIYDISAKNFEVMNFEEWTFDLESANLHPENETLDWYKLYSFVEAYGVDSMTPDSLGKFVISLAKDKSLLEKYNKYKYRMGKAAETECDDECHKENLCLIVTSQLADTQHCDEISQIYDENKSLS